NGDVSVGGTLNLGGTTTFSGHSSFSGSGTVNIEGNLDWLGTEVANFSSLAAFNLVQGQLIVAAGLTFEGIFNLYGGILMGPGSLTIANGSSMTVTSGSYSPTTTDCSGQCPNSLQNGIQVINDGHLTVDTGQEILVGNASVIENVGTMTLDDGATF